MGEPIRVLQVVTHMNRGGLETMLMNYYRNIDRNKVQFDFLTHRPENEKKDYDDEIRSLGGKIYHMPVLNPFSPSYMKSLDRFFKEHKEYKIVHSHLDCLSAYPLKAAKKNGVPVRIAHSHNTSQEKNLKYLIKDYSKKQIPKYATHLFVCGKEAGKWMFGKHKFQIMNNAIDAKKFIYNEEVRKQKRVELGVEDKFVIGHVGRFNLQKNHEFLVKRFADFAKTNEDAILVLIGNGELQEKIKEMAKEYGIETKVKFLGLREDIPQLLQAMDLFLFPSLFEGLPVTLVEAQAAGLPCVISDMITDEIMITDQISKVSLSGNTSLWNQEIAKYRYSKRKNTIEDIIEHGFDIEKNARWLEEFYTNGK